MRDPILIAHSASHGKCRCRVFHIYFGPPNKINQRCDGTSRMEQLMRAILLHAQGIGGFALFVASASTHWWCGDAGEDISHSVACACVNVPRFVFILVLHKWWQIIFNIAFIGPKYLAWQNFLLQHISCVQEQQLPLEVMMKYVSYRFLFIR